MPTISTIFNLLSFSTVLVAAWVAFHMATKPSNSNLNGKPELFPAFRTPLRALLFIQGGSLFWHSFSSSLYKQEMNADPSYI